MAFVNRYDHCEFLVMSLGLTNAPSTFMDRMSSVFRNYLDSFVIAFIDNILVYSKSEYEHMGNLKIALHILKEHQLFDKFIKCDVWLRSIAFLGHIVSTQGIEVDPKKTQAIKNFSRPLTPTNIQN